MILFQQVKQLVVLGSLLRGPILAMLLEERKKISEPVATALRSLGEALEKGSTVDDSLIAAVKECGLCKDISKHQVTDYART